MVGSVRRFRKDAQGARREHGIKGEKMTIKKVESICLHCDYRTELKVIFQDESCAVCQTEEGKPGFLMIRYEQETAPSAEQEPNDGELIKFGAMRADKTGKRNEFTELRLPAGLIRAIDAKAEKMGKSRSDTIYYLIHQGFRMKER